MKLKVKAFVKQAGASFKISPYLESLRFNEKLYNKAGAAAVKALNEAYGADNELVLTFNMSAKFQTPYATIDMPKEDNTTWEALDLVAEALNEFFSSVEVVESRHGDLQVTFRD